MTDGHTRKDVFVHEEGTWNVTGIRQDAAGSPEAFPAVLLDMDPGLILHIERNIRPDPKRMAAIPEELLMEPALAVTLETGRVLLIDGHHRVLRLFREGASNFACIVLDETQTRRYRLA